MTTSKVDHLRSDETFSPKGASVARLQRVIDVLAVAVIVFATIYITARSYRFTYDDVYLAFVYARSVVEGRGMTFNGAEPFLGTPAPLLVLLLVVLKTVLPWVAIPELGGLISGAATLLCGSFVYLLGRRLSHPAVGLSVASLVLVNPLILSTFGSETPLYLALVTGAYYAYFERAFLPSAVLLGLAFLCRSEAVIPTGLLFADFLVSERRLPLREAGASALTVLPWLSFALLYFGSPLTNSFWAKQAQVQGGLLPPLSANWLTWTSSHIIAGRLLYVVFVPLVAGGLYYVVRSAPRWLLFLAWPLLQSIGYLVIGIPFYHWYLAAAGLGISTLAGLAVGTVVAAGSVRSCDLRAWILARGPLVQHARSTLSRAYEPLCRWLPALALAVLIPSAFLAEFRSYSNWVTGLPNPADLIYEKAGLWLRENTAPTASVAYYEIGRIGFDSERRVVDLLGLVTPGVAAHVARSDFTWAHMTYKPDYIIYNEAFAAWSNPVRREPWFNGSYEQVASIQQSGYPSPLVIYRRKTGAEIPNPYLAVDVAQLKHDSTVGEIFGERIVQQTFVANRDGLAKVSLLMATYRRRNTAPLRFELRSESADLAIAPVTRVIDPDSIADGQWVDVSFEPIARSSGKMFSITLSSPEAVPGNAFTVWKLSRRAHDRGSLRIGGVEQSGDLTFQAWSPEQEPVMRYR